jgi:hypothetical protein
MKAKKQKLEEQIINLFLAKQIPEAIKDSMLLALALTKNLEEVEATLNDTTTLKQITEYRNAFAKKLEEVGDQVLQVDNEKHRRQLFNSLVEKGFFKSSLDLRCSDPSCLTDQEFLFLIDVHSRAVEQYKKRKKNE